ncbi:TetR/AcrR family transcriptional regulator [Rhizobium sp. SG570]|uniref:TetR/AcrR family transcriptional regulator n=1 Tax=Rhizobium sp. SG570 TaxID=2587113 RepID=UPI001447A730|nr:TetR/AcrR family transcriptional regulator [Rhizobium sp. SG570]NKJ40129.1 AcrR family transcriptional regulator [Rhizobium sp. SG570]
MRFEKGHKAETRRHILAVASKQFRKEGIEAAGIAGIMKEAGLTNGAFYPHFKSKEELVREAVSSAVGEQQERVEESVRSGRDLEGVLRTYLSMGHLNSPACGCPSASLLPEISRQPLSTRQTYEDGINSYLAVLTPLIAISDAAVAHQRATAIFTLMVGTLQYARAVADPVAAEAILEGGVQAAMLLARGP